jgi:hypothetical protein
MPYRSEKSMRWESRTYDTVIMLEARDMSQRVFRRS